LSVLPLSHMFEFTAGLIGPLVKGATIVYSRIKGPDHLRELLRIEHISVIIGVPAIFQNILKSVQAQLEQLPDSIGGPVKLVQKVVAASTKFGGGATTLNRFLLSPIHKQLGGSIKFWAAGGAPISRELVEGIAGIGIPLLAGYGLTEASPVVAANTRTNNRPGSAGRPLRNLQVRIAPVESSVDSGEAEQSNDNAGASKNAPGIMPRSGEILVRGPNVMREYFEDEEASKLVMQEGWLRTGDLGYLDKDGFLYVTGRIKSTIVTAGGYNIHPEELERVLEMSPAIKEACVFGLTGPAGEQAYAMVVPSKEYADRADDHKFFQEEIGRCLADVSEYKRLAGFAVHKGHLPHTRSRKVKRGEVMRLYQSLQEQKKQSGQSALSYEWDSDGALICTAICEVLDPARKDRKCASDLLPGDVLTGDLGIDSFARLELAVRLEEAFGCRINEEAINDVQTVEEVVELIKAQKRRTIESVQEQVNDNARQLNVQYDLITDRYSLLDTPGHTLASRLARSVQPWPFAARPSALNDETDPAYIDWLRRSIVVVLKTILRAYNHMEVHGADFLSIDPPFIVVANHTSHVDTAAIFASFPPNLLSLLHPIAAADTFFVDRLSSMLSARLLNALPFDRFGDFERSLEECEQLLRHGQILILFPEGTRSPDGVPGVFRTGAARLAASVGCPIIPAHIEGAHQIMPKHARIPRPGKLQIHYGQPLFPVPNASLKDVHDLTKQVQHAVLTLAQAQS
jgi:long-chain acyl-CoA synthetase